MFVFEIIVILVLLLLIIYSLFSLFCWCGRIRKVEHVENISLFHLNLVSDDVQRLETLIADNRNPEEIRMALGMMQRHIDDYRNECDTL